MTHTKLRFVSLALVSLLLSAPFAVIGLATPVLLAPLQFTTVAKGTQSAWPNGEAYYVIKNFTLWRRIWELHSPGTTPPTIDFSADDVYAAFAGAKPTTGYDIETVGLDASSTVHWDVHATQPGTNCNVNPIPTKPFHFVKAPKTGLLALIFVVNETVNCH
ncbi:MAG: protease complex subunit PrcB family protein [Planctomycetota bacterium]